ncbi:hypothetical protein BH10PSE1_BH10PSE1_23430 [soil metagenome]
MAKYDLLRDYLVRLRAREIELTFREIERRIRSMLPNRSVDPGWWASDGEPTPREVQKIAWRSAGFDAVLIKPEQVRFRKRQDGPEVGAS